MMHGTDFCNEATDDTYVDPLSQDEEEEEEEEEETRGSKKKRSKNNKRRFSDEQVKSLETIFASETKLEPRKKVQVARELGLQPRQVAIWFQNKRARWKSKEIEKNYRILKLNYDNLKDRLEVVRKDKESLLTQLQELRTEVARSHEGRSFCDDLAPNSGEHRDTDAGLAGKSSSLQEEMDQQGLVYSDDAKSGNMAYLKQEEHELLDIDGSIISPVKWCSIDAGSLFDQSIISSHWWESWT